MKSRFFSKISLTSAVVFGVLLLAAGAIWLAKNQLDQSINLRFSSDILLDISIPQSFAAEDKEINLEWNDGTDEESLIIQSDKKTYYGPGETEVFFSVTNKTKYDQKSDIYFWFDGKDKRVAEVEKIEDGKISNFQFPISNEFPAPKFTNRKDVKGYSVGSKFQDAIISGQTNFYRAKIKYPANAQGEFFIEAFGDKAGYGHLDPYYDSGLVGYWSFNGSDTALPDNNESSRVFDEKFEGTGYEEANWTEEAVNTVDEDANSSVAGSPFGWGRQCLKIERLADNQTWVYGYMGGATTDLYARVEIVVTAESLANDQNTYMYYFYDSSVTLFAAITLGQNSSGELRWYFISRHDTNWNPYWSLGTVSLNQRYRIELKWSPSTDKWAWKVDGVTQPNDQDSTDPITAEGNLTGAHATNFQWYAAGGNTGGPAYTAYYDLVAYDTADWVGSEGYIKDMSGQSNHGDPAGMSKSAAVPGISGQALKFDGVNDYAAVPMSSAFQLSGDAFTISAWVLNTNKPTNLGAGWDRILSLYDTTASKAIDMGFGSSDGGATLRFYIQDNVTAQVPKSVTGNTTLNAWHHIVAVSDGAGSYQTFLDGVLNTGGSLGSANISTVSTNVFIGQRGDSVRYWKGLIDEVRIYNRALSSSDILNLYQSDSARLKTNISQQSKNIGGLVGYWSFNGPDISWATNTAYDRSGVSPANNGTITNMSSTDSPSAGVSGQALKFDGVNDLVNASSPVIYDNMAALSVSIWAKASGWGESSQGYFISKASSVGAGGWHFQQLVTNKRVEFYVAYDGVTKLDALSPVNSLTTADFGNWVHWVATWDGSPNYSNVHIYKNGVELTVSGTDGLGNRPDENTRNLIIGNDSAGMRTFNGLLDEVRIYNRVLSASDILNLYQSDAAKLKTNISQQGKSTGGLVGYWSFNGPDISWATNTAYDRSGASPANNGTITNMSSTDSPSAGVSGQALKFDGVNDYVSINDSDSLDQPSSFTVAAWVNARSLLRTNTSQWNSIITKGQTGETAADNHNYLLGYNGEANFGTVDRWVFVLENSAGTNCDLIGDAAASLNTWYHVVGVFDDANDIMRLYVNGNQQNSIACALTVNTNALPVRIGDDQATAGIPFNGLIDEVRIYSRALSASEISDLYQYGAARLR